MKVSFLLTAQSEFEETIDYYDEQRTGLGLEFSAEVGQALSASAIILKLGRSYRRGYAVVSLIDFLTA